MIDQVVDKILQIKKKLIETPSSKWTGNQLSIDISQLAILKHSLGSCLAEMENQLRLSENQKKFNEANLFLEYRKQEKTSSKDAEMQIRIDLEEEQQKILELQNKFRKLRIFREDIADLISSLRSRLSYLKKEMEDLHNE